MARTQVQSELLAVNSISGTIIADNAITATHIATNAISGTLVQDGGIVTVMIAANNVTATKIVTDAVQTRHIADDQVTEAKLANAINTSIAAKLPLAGGTMTGDLILGDNVKVEIGSASGGDLQIYHDGSNSYIDDAGTGDLIINATALRPRTDLFVLNNAANNKNQIVAQSGAIKLFYDGAEQLETVSGAVKINNKLGIGIDDPTAYLDVRAPSGVSGPTLAYFKSDQHGLGIYMNVESTYSEIRSNNNSYPLVLNKASGGNVGINTADPSRRLEILDTSNAKVRLAYSSTIYGEIGRKSDGDYEFSAYENGSSLLFGTSTSNNATTVRMKIHSSGRVMIGTTTPAETLTVYSSADSYWALKVDCVNSNYGIQTVGQGSYAIGILNSSSNSYRGRWSHQGTIYSQDGSVHDVDSDERLKEDITDCPSQWSLIKDLPLQRFKWKDRRNGDTFSYGWVAQPTKAKYPEFVEPIPQPKEDIDEGKEDPEYLTVRSGSIQKRSIAALQEAMARIEALEAEVAALKG